MIGIGLALAQIIPTPLDDGPERLKKALDALPDHFGTTGPDADGPRSKTRN
jgi:hypothetical protein